MFDVLAEPNRRRILEILRVGEAPVGALVDDLALSQPAVSKHLRILREAGVVEARVDANRRLYRLRPEARNRLTAAYMTCYFTGGVVGSSLASMAYSSHGWDGVSVLGAAVGACICLIWLFGLRKKS